jgi:O-antigen/teichoic acid export membrane protein
MKTDYPGNQRATAVNVSSAVAMRILRYPVLAAYAIIIPRLLGPEDYGNLAVIVSVLMLALGVLDFGTLEIFGRFAPEYIASDNEAALERLLSSLFSFRIGLTVGLGLIVLATLLALGRFSEEITVWFIIFIILLIELTTSLLLGYLFGLNYVGHLFFRFLLQTLSRLVFIGLFYSWLGFSGAILGLFVSAMVTFVFASYSVGRLAKPKIRRPILGKFWPQLKFGLVIFVPTILVLVQQQVGPILLKLYSTPADEIGYFDLANQGFLLIFGLVATGFAAFIPTASRNQEIGHYLVTEGWLLKFLNYIIPAITLVFFAFFAVGEFFIGLFVGIEYLPVYSIALMMLLGVFGWVIGQTGYVISVSSANLGPYFISMTLSSLAFFLSSLLLIPEYGAHGIAFATIIAGFTYGLSMLIFYRGMANRMLRLFAFIFIAALGWAPLIIYFANGGSLVAVNLALFLFGAVIFLGLLQWIGIINIKEIMKMLQFRKNFTKNVELGMLNNDQTTENNKERADYGTDHVLP